MCAAFSFMIFYRAGERREMVMCAAVSFMVCCRVGETEENGDVWCS